MKRIFGLNIKYLLLALICMIALVFIGVSINHQMLEKWQPDQSITGTWIGSGETRQFGNLESIEIMMTIDESGIVSGTVGEALLEECVIKLNRNDFERFINVKNDYIIREGKVSGMINSRDDIAYRDISMPFNIIDDTIKAVEKIQNGLVRNPRESAGVLLL